MNKNKLTKILIIILSIFVAFYAAIAIIFFVSIRPVSSENNTVSFSIPEGSSAISVFSSLEDKGYIRDKNFALFYSKIFTDFDFKAGDFIIDTSWPLKKMVDHLSDSSNIVDITIDFTIYPGSTVKMIANNLQEVTNLNAEEILNQWNDYNYISELSADYPFLTNELSNTGIAYKLEGYLFPDTYNLFKNTTIDAVTRRFLDNTLNYYNKYLDLFTNNRFSIHEIFTLASIIDYEGNTPEDRKTISSVFINRLDLDMPLQSSATRCYAISVEENRNITDWTECEISLDYDSIYDTYQHFGLPPGPIRCISETSLVAALDPSDTDYLYFIADVCGDGSVYYSNNYSTHVQYIMEYLSKCN